MPLATLFQYIGLGLSTVLLVLALAGVSGANELIGVPRSAAPALEILTAQSPQQLTQTGKAQYQAGQYLEAIALWQTAATGFAATGDKLNQAMVLSNLALAHQQLGQLPQAQQAISQSLQLLGCSSTGMACAASGTAQTQIAAQALTTLGGLQLAQGQAELAWATWQQAGDRYQRVNDAAGVIRTQINQVQALRVGGLYRRAETALVQISQTLANQSDPAIKAAGLISYGDVLQLMGRLNQSQAVLEAGLKLAQQQNMPAEMAAAYLNLGNTARAQSNAADNADGLGPATGHRAQLIDAAFNYYQQAVDNAPSPALKVQAQLNQLSLRVETQRAQNTQAQNAQTFNPGTPAFNTATQTLTQQISPQFAALPLSRTKVYAQISYAINLIKLAPNAESGTPPNPNFKPLSQAAYTLADAIRQIRELQDWRAESFALGYLGHVYEANQQWSEAIELTNQALILAQSHKALDITYRWEWQTGRLYRDRATSAATIRSPQAMGNNPDNQNTDYQNAVVAYKSAFNTLQTLRRDLAAGNADTQFNFQEQTEEPIYREFVDLLLRPKKPGQNNLIQARQVIESLQIAELENFLQEPCVASNPESIDRVTDTTNSTTAALFPIILADRVEVILKLPRQKDLVRYSYPITADQVKATVDSFQKQLRSDYGFETVKQDAKSVYDWLIAPARTQLEAAHIDTLVFVPDSQLRNVPMAALYDGHQFLVENFATTVALNLELQNPQALPKQLRVLAASLTEPPASSIGFAPLANVNQELDAIAQTGITVTAIRDQYFTTPAFNRQINQSSFSIVHLATHGQFSSDPQKTFLLTASGEIKVEDLGTLFRTRGLNRTDTIELLVLSACETASGDNRATLGIAGTTVRAGARSAIASLWSLDDESSVEMMKQFYRQLGQGKVSRAEALRQAQLSLMHNEQYAYPRYWAPLILLGNWL